VFPEMVKVQVAVMFSVADFAAVAVTVTVPAAADVTITDSDPVVYAPLASVESALLVLPVKVTPAAGLALQ